MLVIYGWPPVFLEFRCWNNITLESYRAFISDKLDKKQHLIGFLIQSIFTGQGTNYGKLYTRSFSFFWHFSFNNKMENVIPFSIYWAFGIGAFASIATILMTVFTTLEYPPTHEESERFKEAEKIEEPY